MMSPNLMAFIGVALMSGCGEVIARQIGFGDWKSIVIIGFALGVVCLGRAPTIALHNRVAELEAKLAQLTLDAS